MDESRDQNHAGASRILVIDDDPMIRFLASEELGGTGFEVVDAESGEAGIEAFTRQPPDLVVLDVEMPGMSGFEVCEALRELPGGQHVPILILTGLEDVDSIEEAYRRGATDFASKPISWLVLIHRIRYMLRASASFMAVRRQQMRMDEVQRYARLGSWEVELDTGLLTLSNTMKELVDIEDTTGETKVRAGLDRIHPEDREELKHLVDRAIREESGFVLEHRIRQERGAEIVVHTQGRFQRRSGVRARTLEGFSQDVTERRRTEEQVHFLSYTDPLTGLANRAGFKRRCEETILRASRMRRSAAVLLVDLDHFKRVNDTLGQASGDSLLQYIASALEDCVRGADAVARHNGDADCLVSRLGGDEFTILVEDLSSPNDAARVAQRLIDLLARPAIIEGHEITITGSIGIAVWPHDGETVDELLRNADSAMYHAKARGRANFQFYREELNAHAMERLELETALRRSIDRDEFAVHYQPKVDFRNGRVAGCEALVRWQNAPPGGGSPETFIPIAEACGLIDALGTQVLRQACATAMKWQRDGHANLALAVNLSPMQLESVDITQKILDVVNEVGFDPRLLEVEITESALIHDEGPVLDVLEQLKEHHIGISLDDFGTGYSSLSYLKRFPVECLKIDKSFVAGIGSDSGDEAITAATLSMAHDLGIEVVAEGIETEEQFRFLRDRGCHYAQGFLIAPPLSAEEFERFLAVHAAGWRFETAGNRAFP